MMDLESKGELPTPRSSFSIFDPKIHLAIYTDPPFMGGQFSIYNYLGKGEGRRERFGGEKEGFFTIAIPAARYRDFGEIWQLLLLASPSGYCTKERGTPCLWSCAMEKFTEGL